MIRNALPVDTPCGDIVLIPLELSTLTIQQNKFPVFMLISFKSNIAYIGRHFSKDSHRVGVKFLYEGDSSVISKKYEELPWKETVIQDENGIFHYKEAPSFEIVDRYFENI